MNVGKPSNSLSFYAFIGSMLHYWLAFASPITTRSTDGAISMGISMGFVVFAELSVDRSSDHASTGIIMASDRQSALGNLPGRFVSLHPQ